MIHFKKLAKQSAMVLLIVLASFGVGMVGGVPIQMSRKKEEDNEPKIELVEKKQGEAKS